MKCAKIHAYWLKHLEDVSSQTEWFQFLAIPYNRDYKTGGWRVLVNTTINNNNIYIKEYNS